MPPAPCDHGTLAPLRGAGCFAAKPGVETPGYELRSLRDRDLYFGDPAGNVLELIARDDLGDVAAGAFGVEDLLYVNHAGLVVGDMDAATTEIRGTLGLEPTAPPTPTFTKLGDAYRHVVLVPKGRVWLPEMNRGAEVFAAGVVMHGPQPASLSFGDLPYQITISTTRSPRTPVPAPSPREP